MKTNISLFFICVISLALQGCVTSLASFAMSGLESDAYCPPSARQTAYQNYSNLNALQIGMLRNTVLQGMGQPIARYKVVMGTATELEVWYYRTGHKVCRGLPTTEEFSPVVFQSGKIIGVGSSYYDRYVAYRVNRKYRLAGESLYGEDGLFHRFMYPFNKAF